MFYDPELARQDKKHDDECERWYQIGFKEGKASMKEILQIAKEILIDRINTDDETLRNGQVGDETAYHLASRYNQNVKLLNEITQYLK